MRRETGGVTLRMKKTLPVVWALMLALTLFLTLILPERLNAAVIAAAIFAAVGYASQLLLGRLVPRGTADAAAANAPLAVVSGAYLLCASVFSVVCAVFSDAVSLKAVIVVHFVLLIVTWILLASLLGTRAHIRRVDSRQKDHHIEL